MLAGTVVTSGLALGGATLGSGVVRLASGGGGALTAGGGTWGGAARGLAAEALTVIGVGLGTLGKGCGPPPPPAKSDTRC